MSSSGPLSFALSVLPLGFSLQILPHTLRAFLKVTLVGCDALEHYLHDVRARMLRDQLVPDHAAGGR